MKKGFYTIMSAQFFSSLADNALFVAAVELLKISGAAEWQRAALVPMFALFYVVLAPFVGAFADAVPKGKVMFVSNTIKIVGCLLMLFGTHPLLSYADRRPRRGGLLAGQVRHPHRAAAALAAGQGQRLDRGPDDRLDHPRRAARRAADRPGDRAAAARLRPARRSTPASTRRPRRRSPSSLSLYVVAAIFNLVHPAHRGAAAADARNRCRSWCATSRTCNARLWRDKLGQISLATTTLFWGVSGNLRYIVLAWAAAALGYTTTQASSLVGVVAVGTAVGAVVGVGAHAARRGHRASSRSASRWACW